MLCLMLLLLCLPSESPLLTPSPSALLLSSRSACILPVLAFVTAAPFTPRVTPRAVLRRSPRAPRARPALAQPQPTTRRLCLLLTLI